jgi:hypothetical protein
MIHTIVTHPGGAHKDDLLAVCVLIARFGVPVVRRDPTAGELADPAVALVDIGGSHDPDKMNFDHHHFPREHAPTCALSLVLDHLGLYREALRLCDWLEPAEWFDSRGPNKTATWLGVPRKAIAQLNSPVDMTLLRRFAKSSQLQAGDTLYEFMRLVGADLLEFLEVARERVAFIAAHVQRWSLESDKGTLQALFLPRTDPLPDEPSAALGSYIRTAELGATVAAIVYPDRRGDGYGIGRYEDHPALDFTRVEQEADVHFAHKSGFMCKTSATDPARLRALLGMARIGG